MPVQSSCSQTGFRINHHLCVKKWVQIISLMCVCFLPSSLTLHLSSMKPCISRKLYVCGPNGHFGRDLSPFCLLSRLLRCSCCETHRLCYQNAAPCRLQLPLLPNNFTCATANTSCGKMYSLTYWLMPICADLAETINATLVSVQ